MSNRRTSDQDAQASETLKLESALTYRLHTINKLGDRDTNRAYTQEFGLSLGEGRCLAAIGRFEPVSVNDLARASNLDKGHASRSAQALVERGLVRKAVSEQDGRGVVLTLTASGQQTYEQVLTMIARRNREIFGCLSGEEQARLGEMLERVIAGLRQNAGA
ncbi:MarR family transcriptional regulator [Verticiella sediminum]|uniref:MarR family transcriptional regulator n=1 Tax=Verticiella sediminum TaxID=1247510 RepID=A0A556B276_9BURK|nr:MarR family transcriptional regulator [Verticiella sediminum]TSH99260.1 MarR family transcriptional regulator [Verticiella sediminum]